MTNEIPGRQIARLTEKIEKLEERARWAMSVMERAESTISDLSRRLPDAPHWAIQLEDRVEELAKRFDAIESRMQELWNRGSKPAP